MRGYNLSSKPAEIAAYRAKHLVEDLRLLAEHFGHARFVLVAHDWGGAVAWNFAAAYPDRVEKLVIVNAPHPVTFGRELRENLEQQRASAYMNLFRSEKAERVLLDDGCRRLRRMSIDAWAANGGRANDADYQAYLEAWTRPGALTGGLNWYRASPLHPPDESGAMPPLIDLAAFRVRVPTLVIWGERDEALLPGNLEGLDELVDDLRIERIAEGSHWVIHEQPDRVNALIRGFLHE
jgi:pimeloyl-ACP methyl ester carboxylesterase